MEAPPNHGGDMLNIRPGEWRLATLSSLFHFLVLFGYFLLRPLREAMGASGGMYQLRWLFGVTCLVSLVVVLAFGGVVARTNRRRFIPIAFGFVAACLLVFASLIVADVRQGGGWIGLDAQTDAARYVGYVFFTWLSVVNLVMTSVFWAYMVDIFSAERGRRIFAFIGVGGTLGAFLAPIFVDLLSHLDTPYLPAGLMLLGAGCFLLAVAVMQVIDRSALLPTAPGELAPDPRQAPCKVGGSFWEGLTLIGTSKYLSGVGGWIVLMAISNTLIYFTQANFALSESDTLSDLVGNFAQFDYVAQGLTLFTQLFITARIIRRIGVGWTLATLPLLTLAGFAVLAIWPLYGVILIFQGLHRACRYALSRPARETLYAVLQPAEKYKAKPVIDVFLYRGGDLAGIGFDAMPALLGLGIAGLAATSAPLAAFWIVLSIGLGRMQKRKEQSV